MEAINLIRSAEINYTLVVGDSFAPPPVAFVIDGTDEDFTGCTIRMQVKKTNKVEAELNDREGIAVSGNTLQYSIAAWKTKKMGAGTFKYDVQKQDSAGIVQTIQHGTITLTDDTTK